MFEVLEKTPVQAHLKGDQVLAAMRRAILQGEFAAGERIIELRVAEQFGVSQTPVREALAALAREGLVTRVEHRGSFVAELDDDELAEVQSLRSILEGYAARLAAARVTASDIRRLESIVQRMRLAAKEGDLARLVEADGQFHEVVSEVSGNKLLGEVRTSLHQRMFLALWVADSRYQNLDAVVESHAPLVRALSMQDPDEAEAAAKRHVLEQDLGASGGVRWSPGAGEKAESPGSGTMSLDRALRKVAD